MSVPRLAALTLAGNISAINIIRPHAAQNLVGSNRRPSAPASSVTGVAELAGALGLLFEPTRFWAACGLMILMALMFPANVSAARRGTLIRGRQATALWMRAPMQGRSEE